MTRNRIQLFVLISLSLLLVAGITIFFSIRFNALDKSRMEKVKLGMTYDQVCQVVKCHPGDYSNGKNIPLGHTMSSYWHYKKCNHWICNEGDLSVLFDENGIAIEVKIYPVFRFHEPSTIEIVRNRLGI